jgi:hypothetical protein
VDFNGFREFICGLFVDDIFLTTFFRCILEKQIKFVDFFNGIFWCGYFSDAFGSVQKRFSERFNANHTHVTEVSTGIHLKRPWVRIREYAEVFFFI